MKHKKETLKDGTKVVIRSLAINDLDRMMEFYGDLPPEDRKYLKVDVTNREVVEQRIRLIERGNVFRIVALDDDKVVADGMLEISPEDWRKHQGELRVIVALPYRRKGLGLVIMRELYFLAAEKNLEMLVVQMMRPQVAAQKICRKLGFREELLIPDYVRDRAGKTQDLIIMACDMKDLWEELEQFYTDSDWQRCR